MSLAAAERQRLARRAAALEIRARMLNSVRAFFCNAGFLEVETPVCIPAPAPELHIEAPRAGDAFLQTSPELCMKRLLAAGYGRIFQICRCFRADERGKNHLPEFTMLEWYRAQADYTRLMEDCEAMVRRVARDLGRGSSLAFDGETLELSGEWERLTVAQAFDRYAPVPLAQALATDRFDEVLVEAVEPRLGRGRPTFLMDYPAPLAALSRLKPSDPSVAERFELYLFGREIANAFSELTDEAEQRRRFAAEAGARRELGRADYPSPEPFLRSLPDLPPSAGIALGIDRLAMIFADARHIDDVVAFTPEEL